MAPLRLIVRAPDLAEALTVDLQPDRGILVGRAPDLVRLAQEGYPNLVDCPLDTLRIPSSRISANHLLVLHGTRETWVQDLRSRYVKPVYVAHALGLKDVSDAGRALNYSALGRQLDIADGTTVKNHLARYFDRFGKK